MFLKSAPQCFSIFLTNPKPKLLTGKQRSLFCFSRKTLHFLLFLHTFKVANFTFSIKQDDQRQWLGSPQNKFPVQIWQKMRTFPFAVAHFWPPPVWVGELPQICHLSNLSHSSEVATWHSSSPQLQIPHCLWRWSWWFQTFSRVGCIREGHFLRTYFEKTMRLIRFCNTGLGPQVVAGQMDTF